MNAKSQKALSPRIQKLAHFYNDMTPGYEKKLSEIYAEQFYFSDPYLTTSDSHKLANYFAEAPYKFKNPKIEILRAYEEPDSAVVFWVFRAKKLGLNIEVLGSWHLQYDANDRIHRHIDYWDFYAQVLEKLPVLGLFFKYFKKLF